MAKQNKKETTLQDLLIQKLEALYDVENNLVKALPKMAKHATNDDLVAGLEEHLEQTKGHVTRLEKAFKLLKAKPAKLKGGAIKGLVADADWVMSHVEGPAALDANLIAAAQYVEHYEIAGYGSALAWAQEMGHSEVAGLLEETLAEEQEANEKLTALATGSVNGAANEVEADVEAM